MNTAVKIRRCFATQSTTSPGKLLSEKFIVETMNPNGVARQGFLAGVVGCDDGAPRHAETFEFRGYTRDKHLIIDLDEEVHARLVICGQWPRENVILGGMSTVVRSLSLAGKQITEIDADSHAHFGEWQVELAEFAVQTGIPRMAFTFTTRVNWKNPFLENLGDRVGCLVKSQSNRFLPEDIVMKYLRRLCKGTGYRVSEYFPYHGVSNMATVCIYKEEQTNG